MKPVAVPTAYKCSVCDLPWDKHGEKPTLQRCVDLLKMEVARLRTPNWGMESTGKTYVTNVSNIGKAKKEVA